MRKKLLRAIAAVTAGVAAAGGAAAQTPRPTAPAPLAQAGAFDAGAAPAGGFNPAMPGPGMPGPGMPDGAMPGPGMGGPGMPGDPAGGGDPLLGGGPQYPPPGPYMQNQYEKPANGVASALRANGAGSRNVWFSGEYLLYSLKAQPAGFPLLTTGAPADNGVLGAGTTNVLVGDRDLGLGTASGFRLSGGFWSPYNSRLGVDVTGLYIAPASNNLFVAGSGSGIPVLARPFTAAGSNVQTVQLVSFPTFFAGSAATRATTKFFGIDADGVVNLFRTCPDECRSWSVNGLIGGRFLELHETLGVSTRSQLLPGRTAPFAGTTVAAPTVLEVRDNFDTKNDFYGGQVGLQSQFTSGHWYVGLSGKVAFGFVHEVIDINGATAAVNTANGTASVAQGGLFANASNIGRRKDDEFAIVTDLNVSVGYHLTSWLTATVGYNFTHLNSCVRPGNLFNGTVDPTLIPTSASFGGVPANAAPFDFRRDDFFVHGVSFGFIAGF